MINQIEKEEEQPDVPEDIPIKEKKGRFVANYKLLNIKLPYIEIVLKDIIIHFNAPTITKGKKCVLLTLFTAVGAEKMMIHNKKGLPVIFTEAPASYAYYFQLMINMNENTDLFIPKSEDLKKNKLTFFIESLNEDQINFMRFVILGPETLIELDVKGVNEILQYPIPRNKFMKVSRLNLDQVLPSTPTPVTLSGVSPGACDQAITKETNPPSDPDTKLLTYPQPPQTGGIAINTADLDTLKEGKWLNDVIIEFYLKYVFYEKLSSDDQGKTHIFSSYFYSRLTEIQKGESPGEESQEARQLRQHNQVKNWTRKLDIFSKDYIIIPVNETCHWILVIICYPGRIPDATVEKIEPNSNKGETINNEDNLRQNDSANSDSFFELPERCMNSRVPFSESGGQRKEMPCILLFDSLNRRSSSKIISMLREYLEQEWKMKKGTRKIFDGNTIQGFIIKCPQQTNSTDCGLYALQYMESFFESPIPYFGNPMPDLTSWFSTTKISKKRQEIKELILSLQKKYQTEPV